LPHARAEDEVLYPVVEEILGATGATATMSRDHVEIARRRPESATTLSAPPRCPSWPRSGACIVRPGTAGLLSG